MMVYSKALTDEEIKCLEHYVPDVKEWIDQAIEGKINSCKKRLFKGEIEKSLATDSPFPATQKEVLMKVFSHPDYQSRRVRDGLPPKEVIATEPEQAMEPPIELKEESNGQPT